jgi:G3E family GTPase
MIRSSIPVTLITGATGAGKTTLIARLLGERTAAERWAVLVNDFGRAALTDVPASGAVAIREVSGCICCTGQVTLRTAIVKLVREASPDRLLIEASAAAEPQALLRVLREAPLASTIGLRRIVCVVNSLQLADARYSGNAVYRAQIAGADCVMIVAGIAGDTSVIRATVEQIAGKALRFVTPADIAFVLS